MKTECGYRIECKRCGVMFQTPDKRKQYCSRWCWYNKTNNPEYMLGKQKKLCAVCGKGFTVPPARVKTSKCCSFRCKQVACGRIGGAIIGDRLRGTGLKHRYVKYHGRHLHRVVAERMLGRPLRPTIHGEVVHHKNNNGKDNAACNLEVTTQSRHAVIHIKALLAARKAKHGY